ncbi:MAG: ParB N-terminal domain-containing protein [Dehalococcoidia bacterium]
MKSPTISERELAEAAESGGPLPALVLAPRDIYAAAHNRRDMPTNSLGGADIEALLRGGGKYEHQREAIRGLLKDIAADRLVFPVVVRPDPDGVEGRYQLLSGWLVWSAALHLGKERINALVWDGNDLEALALAYRLNHHRLQMKRSETTRIARRVARLLAEDMGEVTYREVAAALGCSPSWAHKLLHPETVGASGRFEGDEYRRPRGRPPVSPVLSFEIADPRGWESSVRLRVIVTGKGPAERVRLQRSEEFEAWRDVTMDEFLGALSTEVERLQDWLHRADPGSGKVFFLGKNGDSNGKNEEARRKLAG